MYNNNNNKDKDNNAKRAIYDENFTDLDATTEKERVLTGVEIEVTRYSDGSSTHHFGGPCGSVNYDEFGEEC